MAEAFIVRRGGGGSGGTLVVTSAGAGTVTVSNSTLGKSYSKSVTAGGSVTFKGLKTGTWTVQLSNGTQTSTKTVAITSDYSTSIAYFSATISITYPANSNCVVTNSGGQTVASNTNTGSSTKTWTATVNATGTYTVTATATDGSGKSKSQSVSITADGQSKSVELSYNIWLIHNGAVQSNTFSVFSGTPKTFEKVGSVFRVALSTSTISAYFDNKIDCSKISSIKIVLAGGKTAYNLTFGLISEKTAFNPGTADDSNKNIFPIASAVVPGGTFSTTTKTIDVSGNSGSYYLGCTLDYTGGMNDATYGHGGFDITDIELIEVE